MTLCPRSQRSTASHHSVSLQWIHNSNRCLLSAHGPPLLFTLWPSKGSKVWAPVLHMMGCCRHTRCSHRRCGRRVRGDVVKQSETIWSIWEMTYTGAGLTNQRIFFEIFQTPEQNTCWIGQKVSVIHLNCLFLYVMRCLLKAKSYHVFILLANTISTHSKLNLE